MSGSSLIGHNGGPPLDEEGVPKLPVDRLPTTRELNTRGRVMTNRLGPQVNSGIKTKAQALGEFAQESGVRDWLGTQVGRFLSSLDGPKPLVQRLKQGMQGGVGAFRGLSLLVGSRRRVWPACCAA